MLTIQKYTNKIKIQTGKIIYTIWQSANMCDTQGVLIIL